MTAPLRPTKAAADGRGPFTALVAGATGLIGGHLIRLLVRDPRYHRIVVLARRPLPPHLDGQGVRTHVLDFERLETRARDLAADLAVDHVFCALGTTLRAAGSRARFQRVDLDYTRMLARLARQAGARHFSLVSSIGANPESRVFYSRVKGEAEAAVRELGYPSGSLLRPSILGGEREQDRPIERVGQRIAALIPGRYRLVKAEDVAWAMVDLAVREEPGWRVVESEEVRRIAWARR
jgi:uncharacterized protein YbjT (DUF2867 family)